MLKGELLNDQKEALAEQLKAVAKAARDWKASLTVELDGIGLYDHPTQRGRQSVFMRSVERVNDMLQDTVPQEGLLAEAER